PTDTNASACWMDFIRLGLAGTKCGSVNPGQRLCAVTCLPPTYCATEARSVSEGATLRSASAGLRASPASAAAIRSRTGTFMGSSRTFVLIRELVGMSRVIADGVADLSEDAVVVAVNPGVGVGVAVFEPHERELRRVPGHVCRDARHLGGERGAELVHHEVGKAV